jgi:5,6-dimethylbenzimidazole synthase
VSTPAKIDVRFSHEFGSELERLLAWRRDVRRFRSEPLPAGLLEDLVSATRFAPSVGYCQPSRFVRVDDASRRAAVIAEYERCNASAAGAYDGDRLATYKQLKLAGLREAPIHLAVFADTATSRGQGLGRRTMPETLAQSAVIAVHTLWLVARAKGVGVGWVSILEPAAVTRILAVPEDWKLVAYLCLGYPQEEHEDRELARAGWESHDPASTELLQR